MDISIVIPCYNEENNLKRGVLSQVSEYLSKQKYKWEVIICNDESTDGSKKIISEFILKNKNFTLINIPHGGKPAAVWAGIQKANYSWVLFTDMDQSTPLKELEELIPFFNKNDIVIGSRGTKRSGATTTRKIMAKAFRGFRKSIILSHINDTQCGFKALKTTVAKRLFPRLGFFTTKKTGGWTVSSFDAELLFMAEKCNYKISEIEVEWNNEDTSTTKGDDAERFKKESRQMLSEIIRVRLNDLKGLYENI